MSSTKQNNNSHKVLEKLQGYVDVIKKDIMYEKSEDCVCISNLLKKFNMISDKNTWIVK